MRNPATMKGIKSKIKKIIPFFINDTLDKYSDFYASDSPLDAKGFSAHHSACKSALAHMEALLKIARWSDEENYTAKQEDINWKNLAQNALMQDKQDFLDHEEE